MRFVTLYRRQGSRPSPWKISAKSELVLFKLINQTDYVLCSQRWRSSILSAKTRPGADCGSDHELLIDKFRLKLKKVGKSTRPFRYDLNQIPYDYTVEVRNRFKGLDLIECLMNYGWRFMTLYRRQGSDHPHEKEMQKSKMAV